MKKHFQLILAATGVAALVAAGCSSASRPTVDASERAGVETKPLAPVPGFDPATNTIHVGVISPLTGPAAFFGLPITHGNENYFKYVNSKGGIAGRYQVKLEEQDSKYSDDVALQAYDSLRNNTVMIGQLLGTPQTKALLPVLRKDGMVASPADLNADFIHDPNLLPLGVPYQYEMINGADYIVNGLGLKGKTFCSLAENTGFGKAGQAGVDWAGFLLGYSMKVTPKYEVGATNFTSQIQELKSSGCEVVFLVSTPDATSGAFSAAMALGYAPQWIGSSPSYLPILSKVPALLKYMSQHFLLISEGPEWDDLSSKGAADLNARLKEFSPNQEPDYFFAFGYLQAWAVTQVLEKAVALGDISRPGIMNAMAHIGTMNFDGLTSGYQYGPPADRHPGKENSIFKVNGAKPAGLEQVKAPFVSEAARAFAQYTSGS